jgi:hypothetical protein
MPGQFDIPFSGEGNEGITYKFGGTKHLNSVVVTHKSISSDKHHYSCRPLHHVTEVSMSTLTVINH